MTTITYDEGGDVLYVNVGSGVARHGVEGDDGIVWHYDENEILIRVTMLDFVQRLTEGKEIKSAVAG